MGKRGAGLEVVSLLVVIELSWLLGRGVIILIKGQFVCINGMVLVGI